MDTAALVTRLLDVIETDIAARTRQGVAGGNKLFGAAILRKSDLSLVIAETNNETENPLWHGEMHAIKRFYELPRRPASRRPRTASSLPPTSPARSASPASPGPASTTSTICSATRTRATASASRTTSPSSRKSIAVPDPETGTVSPDRPLYNRVNAFWQSHSITQMIAGLDRGRRERLLRAPRRPSTPSTTTSRRCTRRARATRASRWPDAHS